MTDNPRLPLDSLSTSAVALVRQWDRSEVSRTQTLRDLAEVVMALRSRFAHRGLPDWAGRSWEYRSHMTAIYEAAQVPHASQVAIQSSLRYHVGNLLRDTLPASDLEAVGLKTESPKDRVADHRELLQAAADAKLTEWGLLGAEGVPVDVDAVRMVSSATTILGALKIRGNARPAELDFLDRSLDRLADAVARARSLVETARSNTAGGNGD